jgi:hypothetical protein|tara:strand:+ start:3017 stop:3205 length:189 start_codon:yes stop_codon:yes gene_type:complete
MSLKGKAVQKLLDFSGKAVKRMSDKSVPRSPLLDIPEKVFKNKTPKPDARSKAFYDSIYKKL